jgi:acyl carrier protein
LPILQSVDASDLEQNKVVPLDSSSPGRKVLVGCGKPVAPVDVVIANPVTHEPCAPNQIGEIWIAGPSVALGYWGRPEETERTYKAHLVTRNTEMYFRSGDLGYLQQGELFVTGRLKDCIIIRGQNHYPQDIESTVENCHSAVRRHATAAFCIEGDGEEQLIIAAEIDRHHSGPRSELFTAIRRAVSEAHELQVAGAVLLQAGTLPKTSSGKIQRQLCKKKFLDGSLPAIEVSMVAPRVPAALRPAIDLKAIQQLEAAEKFEHLQTHLQQLAAHAMRVPPASIDLSLSLTALGIDSLVAVQITHDLQEDLGLSLPLPVMLDCRDLRHLTTFILEQLSKVNPVEGPRACERDNRELPLSSGEQRLWVLQQLNPENIAYNEVSALRLTGNLNTELLQESIRRIVARHETCRTNYVLQGERAVRVVRPALSTELRRFDLRTLPKNEQEIAWRGKLREIASRPFHLASDALLRTVLFELNGQDHVLGVVVHHIICDGWSLGIFARELAAAYEALSSGAPSLPDLPLQYADYVLWQQEQGQDAIREDLNYWLRQLAELPILELPVDIPQVGVRGKHGDQASIMLGPDLTQKIRHIAKEQGATLFMALTACFQLLLSRYSAQKDIVIGTPVANRNWHVIEGLIGFFVNTLVLRTKFPGNPTFPESLRQVRATILDAVAHQTVPFEKLVEELQPSRDFTSSK